MDSDRSDDGDLAAPLVRVGQVVDAEMPWSKHRVKAALFGDPVLPPTVGHYEIRGTLGRGGMGVVLDAFDAKLGRRVALKLLSPRLSEDEAATARLLREAQALARLSHPNVVHVYETGTTDDDLVYLAMERVEGQTLLSWQRARSRGWRECLEMYLQAGEGLAAAHAEGLVHRDFKPNNCMVDAKGRVRVLDFGLALALDEGVDDAGGTSGPSNETAPILARLTRRGTLVGTVAYMAPEQLAGLPTDPRSDQFSFCVSLYEALCGHLPFGGDSISARHDAIREGRPRPAPRGVPRALLGVVGRGLAFEPEQRHSDLPGLLAALRRVPVARRRRWNVGLVAVGVVGLGAAWMASGPSPCDGVREQAPRGWDDERREAVVSALSQAKRGGPSAAAMLSEQLDGYASAWQQDRFEACVQEGESPELASRRRACLDRLDGKLLGLTRLIGRADGPGIGMAAVAVDELVRPASCGLADGSALGSMPVESQQAEVAAVREQIDEAGALLATEQLQRGQGTAAELVDRARRTGHATTLAEALLLEGRLRRRAALAKDARGSLLEALQHAERDAADLLAADVLVELVNVELDRGVISAAEGWQEMLDGKLGRVGEPLDGRAKLVSTRGRLASDARHHEEAIRFLRQAVEMLRESAGDASVPTARGRAVLAGALTRAGHDDEARAVYAEALARLDENFASLPSTALLVYDAAILDLESARLGPAIEGFSRAARILRGAGVHDGELLARAELGLSRAFDFDGDAPAAERHVAAALVAAQTLPPTETLRADIESQRAALAYAKGDYRGALDSYRQVQRILEAGEEPDPVELALLASSMGEAELGLGEIGAAEVLFTKALAELGPRLSDDDDLLAYPLRGQGEVLLVRGDPVAARPVLERALAIRTAHDADQLNLAQIRWALARALVSGATEDESELVRERALALARAARATLGKADGDGARLSAIDEFLE